MGFHATSQQKDVILQDISQRASDIYIQKLSHHVPQLPQNLQLIIDCALCARVIFAPHIFAANRSVCKGYSQSTDRAEYQSSMWSN